MYSRFRFIAALILTVSLLPAISAYAQDQGFFVPSAQRVFLPSDGRNLIRVQVKDNAGNPIRGAVVRIDVYSTTTDSDGLAIIQDSPGLRVPNTAEISATGFTTGSVLIGSFETAVPIDVYLERKNRGIPQTGGTVRVGELTRDVQERSDKLQEEGAKALESQDYETAEYLFRQAADLTPSAGNIYHNIGITLLRRDRFDEASAYLQKAAELNPYDPLIVGNLGLIRWMQRRTDESFPLLEKAVAGGFSSPTAHYALGIMYLQQREYKQAEQQLSKAKADHLRLRDLYLSIAEQSLGRAKSALRYFQKFIMRNPVALETSDIPSIALVTGSHGLD